jgi:AraC-like DNA-binding protein
VTSDARELPAGARGSDLVLAAVVGPVIEAGVMMGLERAALLRKLGLTADDFADPDALLPFETFIAAWETLAEAPGSEEIGLRIGAKSSPRLLGALGYAMIHAPDALAAIRMFHRFRRLVSDTLAPEIDIDERHVTYHLVWPARVARIFQFADSAFLGTLSLLRELAGLPDQAPLAVDAWYQCPAPGGTDRSKLLGCPVRFGAPETRFVLNRKLLEQPLPRTDPGLFAYLERHAEAVLARIPKDGGTAARVRRLITEALRSGEPTPTEIGKKLSLSERTLQRRLRDERTSFAELLDGTRRELSAHYLSDPSVAAFEIAFLLGYSEPSAFHRAFRRWTGTTPQEFRRAAKPKA